MKTNQPTNDMDEATEERIASWVLGEASPMEAKQLEALCEEQALWRDYEKKLRAIHRLLDEDAKDVLADHQWKMAAEKRDTLLAAISHVSPSSKGKRTISWMALARVACLVIFASLAAAYINHSTMDHHRQMALLPPPKVLEEQPLMFKAAMDDNAEKRETGNDVGAVESMASHSINDEQMIAGKADRGLRASAYPSAAGEGNVYGGYAQKSQFEPTPSFEASSSMRFKALPATVEATASWSSQRAPDDSFQEAFAAFKKGQRLPPQAIRVEDFYNAFDYGDPAPSANEPIAFFSEQAVNPLQPQQLWLRISLQTASFGRDAQQSLHLTFVIDQSAVLAGKEQREVLADAMRELGKLLTERDRVSVIGFAASARLLGEFIVGSEADRWLPLVLTTVADKENSLEKAIALGQSIAIRHKSPTAQNRIVCFLSNPGNANQETLLTSAKSLRQQGLHLDIVSMSDVEQHQLRYAELASYGNGRYQQWKVSSEAGTTFANQWAGPARPTVENVKTQVRFHRSRVANFKLQGWEQNQRNMQAKQKGLVDTSEISFGALGNSFYEIIPQENGDGDIGQAMVRYRDTVNGKMEERTWTIPWQPSPPALIRASPSMQLGGLSVMLGNQLQSNATLPMPSPNELGKVIKTVDDNFAPQDAAQKLLQMIPALTK